jgi:hypothetical protein
MFIFLMLLVSSVCDELKGMDNEEGCCIISDEHLGQFAFSIIRDINTTR